MDLTNVLRLLNTHFNRLSFEPLSHQYIVDNENYISVTTICKNFYTPFDKSIANFVAKSKDVSVSTILDEWENKQIKGANEGTEIHEFAEKLSLAKSGYMDVNDPLFAKKVGVKRYLDDLPKNLEIIGREVQVYSKQYKIAGTIDVLLYDHDTETLVIDDYKTNKSLFDNYKSKKLLPPFENMLDNNFNKYTLQLNTYKLLLAETFLPVSKMRLIHIKEYEYELLEVEDVTEPLKKYYEDTRLDTTNPFLIF